MVEFQFEIEGGGEFKKILDSSIDELNNIGDLYKQIIAYFEGRLKKIGKKTINEKSPIELIFESQGEKLGVNWIGSPKTWEDKKKNWDKYREFDLPGQFSKPMWQIHTGATLRSLLDSGANGAIRVIGKDLVFGTSVPWAAENQEKVMILAFFPGMEEGINHILTAWMRNIFREIEDKDYNE